MLDRSTRFLKPEHVKPGSIGQEHAASMIRLWTEDLPSARSAETLYLQAPPGTGKSNTLKASLSDLNQQRVRIIDPVILCPNGQEHSLVSAPAGLMLPDKRSLDEIQRVVPMRGFTAPEIIPFLNGGGFKEQQIAKQVAELAFGSLLPAFRMRDEMKFHSFDQEAADIIVDQYLAQMIVPFIRGDRASIEAFCRNFCPPGSNDNQISALAERLEKIALKEQTREWNPRAYDVHQHYQDLIGRKIFEPLIVITTVVPTAQIQALANHLREQHKDSFAERTIHEDPDFELTRKIGIQDFQYDFLPDPHRIKRRSDYFCNVLLESARTVQSADPNNQGIVQVFLHAHFGMPRLFQQAAMFEDLLQARAHDYHIILPTQGESRLPLVYPHSEYQYRAKQREYSQTDLVKRSMQGS